MKTRSENWWGGVLIALGALFLLYNWGLFDAISRLFWSVAFLGGAAVFIAAYLSDRSSRWWALIPGFSLLALGAVVAFGDAFGLGGSLFLGLIGLGFVAVYLSKREHWWAVIPAGTLLTLAVVAGVDQTGSSAASGSIFFLGLALTFLFVYLLPGLGRRTWALIPASALLLLAVMAGGIMTSSLAFIWPILLIGGGLYLMYQQRGGPGRSLGRQP